MVIGRSLSIFSAFSRTESTGFRIRRKLWRRDLVCSCRFRSASAVLPKRTALTADS